MVEFCFIWLANGTDRFQGECYNTLLAKKPCAGGQAALAQLLGQIETLLGHASTPEAAVRYIP